MISSATTESREPSCARLLRCEAGGQSVELHARSYIQLRKFAPYLVEGDP